MTRTIEECLAIYDSIPLPESFDHKVTDGFINHYMYKIPGQVVHICSKCGKENRLKSKHNENVTCKHCGINAKVIHTKCNTQYWNHGYSYLVNVLQKKDNLIIHTRYEAILKIVDKKEQHSVNLVEIKIIDGKEITIWSMYWNYGMGSQWVKRKLNLSYMSYFGKMYSKDIYPESMTEFLDDTDLKYSCLGEAFDKGLINADPIDAFLIARKYPMVEMIWKSNNRQLYTDLFNDVSFKREVKYMVNHYRYMFRKGGLDLESVYRSYKLMKAGIEPGPDTMQFITGSNWSLAEEAMRVKEKVGNIKTTRDIIKYLIKQKEKDPKFISYHYTDYINLMEKIGTPVDTSTIFPKNLKEAHDTATNKFNAIKYEKENQKYAELVTSLKRLEFGSDGLLVIVPVNVSEILQEGKALTHCVGSYVDKVVKGETAILFVRKAEDPESPYYTMEYREKRIIQCRGDHNKDMTPEVKEFIQNWLEWSQKTKRKPKKEVVQMMPAMA